MQSVFWLLQVILHSFHVSLLKIDHVAAKTQRLFTHTAVFILAQQLDRRSNIHVTALDHHLGKYLDYQNRRAEHVKKLWEIVDWEMVESRLNI